MRMFELIAFAPPAPPGTDPNPTGQMLQMIGMFVILGVMFYFLLIRPQQKQRREHEALLRNVRSGDRILTTGGIYGIVTNVKDKSFTVKIADNVRVEIAKNAVANVIQKSSETAAAESKQEP
jgi:preprotein translocase subunit YajC